MLATWFALTRDPVPMPAGCFADKWAHLATYLLLAVLVDLHWPENGFDWRKGGCLLGYGLAIEMIQSQVPRYYHPRQVRCSRRSANPPDGEG